MSLNHYALEKLLDYRRNDVRGAMRRVALARAAAREKASARVRPDQRARPRPAQHRWWRRGRVTEGGGLDP